MPLVAFVPPSPLLPAGQHVGDVAEVVDLRDAAREAVTALVADAPGRVVVLAFGDSETRDERAGGSLRPHGVEVDAGGDERVLGLGHTVGAWLLDEAGWSGPRAYVGVGSGLLALGDHDALLVVADGSARRTDKAPGHLEDRAEPFDAVLEAALADGDADVLGGVDQSLADAVWCTTAPVWRAAGDAAAARLAAHAGAHGPARPTQAGLRLATAPLGVGWFVAGWTLP